MVAGVHGVTGAHALKRVALDHSTANDPVLGPLRHMEENHARDKLNRQELVTRSFAPYMVVGLAGLSGVHALKHVEMESSTADGTVIIPCQNMEARDAMGQL